MSEMNDVSVAAGKSSGDRTVMHILYGLHTVSPFTAWTLAVIALIVNYIKKGDETDPLYLSHHDYMIRTFWWTVLWLVLATVPAFTVVLIPLTWFLYFVVGAWYLYRCLRGWLRFNDNKLAPT